METIDISHFFTPREFTGLVKYLLSFGSIATTEKVYNILDGEYYE